MSKIKRYDITLTRYWREFRHGGGHYSRKMRNNDIRFGARMNIKCHGSLGRAVYRVKGAIKAQREALQLTVYRHAKLCDELGIKKRHRCYTNRFAPQFTPQMKKTSRKLSRATVAVIDLDDDGPLVVPKKKLVGALAAMLDDEAESTETQTSALNVAKSVRTSKDRAPTVAQDVAVKQLSALPACYMNTATSGGVRIQIIDALGKDFKDVLCYNWELKCAMHMKVEDLQPTDSVREVINFLRTELHSLR